MKLIAAAVTALCLIAAPVVADPSADSAASTSPATAHLSRDDGKDGRAHVHVSLNRDDIAEVSVELFDREGASLAVYSVAPRVNGRYRSELSVGFAPEIDAKIDRVRVTGFVIKREAGDNAPVFDTGVLGATPMSCAGTGLCNPTRSQCSNDCFVAGCTSATYSCTDQGAGCEATCTCLGCS